MRIQSKIAVCGASLLIAVLAFTVDGGISKSSPSVPQQGQDIQSMLQKKYAIRPDIKINDNIQQMNRQTRQVEAKKLETPKEQPKVEQVAVKEEPKAEPKKIEPAPAPKVEAKPVASRSGVNTAPKGEVIHATATAYGATPLNGGAGTWVTATGTKPTEGRTIAVDPRMIPLGSTVIIECPTYPSVNGTYIAEDTGGAIKNSRIDIFMNDSKRQTMLEFGVRNIVVTVIQK